MKLNRHKTNKRLENDTHWAKARGGALYISLENDYTDGTTKGPEVTPTSVDKTGSTTSLTRGGLVVAKDRHPALLLNRSTTLIVAYNLARAGTLCEHHRPLDRNPKSGSKTAQTGPRPHMARRLKTAHRLNRGSPSLAHTSQTAYSRSGAPVGPSAHPRSQNVAKTAQRPTRGPWLPEGPPAHPRFAYKAQKRPTGQVAVRGSQRAHRHTRGSKTARWLTAARKGPSPLTFTPPLKSLTSSSSHASVYTWGMNAVSGAV